MGSESTTRSSTRSRGWLLAALLLGTALVVGYDRALTPSRYPYSGDSASYIEMAESLRSVHRPLVTPWDVDPGDRDAVPQPLFPPAFPLLIAALTPLAGDARTAVLWPGRVAAALLPLLLLAGWRGALPPAALAALGFWSLLAPGVREWQFIGYSDLSALAFAVGTLAALARGLGKTAPAGWLLLAGLLAGLGYALRNSGLAVCAAAAATLLYCGWRRQLPPRAAGAFAAGLAPPLAALAAYNLMTFGRLLPYAMPPSARGWLANLGDYASAQLSELGLPPPPLPPLPALAATLLMTALVAALATAWWQTRARAAVHRLLTLLGAYLAAGALLLIASRSRYEWGGLIDGRYALQYSWAFGLALVLAVRELLPPRALKAGAMAAMLVVAAFAVDALRDARAARLAPPESWLELSQDPALLAAARQLTPQALIASNTAVLFRIAVQRPVRQLDVSGGDRDFAGSLEVLRLAAGARPAAFLLVCNEWTAGFSACGAAGDGAVPDCTSLRAAPPRAALCVPPERGPVAANPR